MILKRLVEVESRLYRHRTINEEGITQLNAWHEVVITVVGMEQFHTSTQVEAVLCDVIASTNSHTDMVGNSL